MKKGLKYSLLTFAWIVAIVVLLLLLASLLIQTQPAKNRLARFSEKQAGKVLNGELTIGKIDGNFFTGLILENVLLKYENDTLAYIDKFTVHYNLWSLVDGDVNISTVKIENPYFYFEQHKDSTWNVQNIVKTRQGEKDTTASPGKFEISLFDVSIKEGTIKTNTPDTIIPERVENWNTDFSLFLGGKEQNAKVESFSLSTLNPNFSLNQLTFKLNRDSNYIQLTDFFIKTEQNQMEGNAEYSEEPNREGSADFETPEFHLNEFEYFIPSMKLPAKPAVAIDAEMEGDSVFVNFDLKENDQHIIIKASSPNLAAFLFNNQKPELVYTVDGTLENIELGHWIGNPELNYYINGQLSASGRGIDPANASIEVNADFNETLIEDKRLTELLVDLQLNQGNLGGIVQGDSEFGEFRISPEIQNLFDYPVYQAEIQTNNLNLAKLTGNDSLSSNLNLSASVNGESFDPEQMKVTAEIIFSDSRFREIQIDILVADAGFQNQNLQIDSLWLKTDSVTLNAFGNYHLNGMSNLNLSAKFEGIEEFKQYIPVDNLITSGNIKAQLQGTIDSFDIATSLELNRTKYTDIMLQSFKLDANATLSPQDTTFDAHGIANELVSGENKLDSVAFDVNGNLDSMFLAANIANNDISTQIETGFNPGDVLTFTISEWQIDYKKQEWTLQQTPATIKIDSLTYSIDNFKLTSGQNDSSMYILLQGEITRNGQEDFLIEMANIDLKEINELLELETNVAGTFNLEMKVEGTAQAPVINGNYQLSNAAFNKYSFTEFKGEINYIDEHLYFSTLVIPEDSGKVDLTASIPLEIRPDTMGFHFNPKDSIDGRLIIEKFPLAILRAFDITGDIAGHLEGDVSLSGTAESPQTEGKLRLQDASVEIDEYGIDYRDIRLNLNFDNNMAVLDTLNIRSDDGSLTGTGQVNFESDFYKGNVSESQINLDFDQFNLVDHDQFNMQVTGNANLVGKKGNVVYGGDLKIPQAEIYLPAILGMAGQMSTPEIPKPILVRELERMDISADSINIQTFSPLKPDSSMQFTYLNDLQGQLRIRIPKNTWIKNENMRVEISGEIELRKNNEYFELFGSVDVVRGQYDLLGKMFNITKGSVSFQGGEKIQPKLNISAIYSFRNAQKASQDLSVQITGTPESPEVNFMLDGSTLSEGDALSYILFGKSMNELTFSEHENVSGSANIAEKAAASLLSSQLSNFLGDQLNVDYIEVKSDGSFDNASVVVGKYITNNLFVSYEQRFGEVDEKDVAKYEVKMEYELFRFLFFELNNSSTESGFDVILKFDVK